MDERRVDAARRDCDARLPEWRHSRGRSGSVTITVERVADEGPDVVVALGERLWQAVNRPNALIGISADATGVAAMRQLVSMGVCVDMLEVQGADHYGQVLDAYMEGLAAALARGLDLGPIRAVVTTRGGEADDIVAAALDARRSGTWRELVELGAHELSLSR